MENYTVTQLVQMLKNREISSLELTKKYLDKIKAANDELNAFISITEEQAIYMAKSADKRIAKGESSELLGIPMAVKDNICTKDIRTTCASRLLEDYIPPYNATAVDKLLSAGAVLLGKTNLDEFGMGSRCENSIFGPTVNPNNIAFSAGGSSGGSAAAVSAGMVPFALGSDTGGSVRQPAAHCGIVGIKPTYGAVSRYGLVAFASSFDQIGVMGSNVCDAELVLRSITGRDSHDATTKEMKRPVTIGKLRFGVIKELESVKLSPEVKAAYENALKLLAKQGSEIIQVSVPHISYATEAYYIISSAEASSDLARFDGVRYGKRSKEGNNLSELCKNTRGEGFGREVKRRIMLGTFVLSSGYCQQYYQNAMKVKSLITNEMERAFDICDVIISPITPSAAPLTGADPDPVTAYREDIFTVPANLTGIPAISVPCGKTEQGLPIGLQLMGRPFSEEILCRAAEKWEVLHEADR